MSRWARLTWQSADPSTLAAGLQARLGVPARDGGLVLGAHLLHLGSAELEVRPWVREGPDDRPRDTGRLVLEPVPGGEPAPATAPGGAPAVELVGIGWSTVELDRSEAELDPWLGAGAACVAHDPQLGARARLRGGGRLPATWIVLLEPSTEGRVAASLARDGEGPCAIYLAPDGPRDRAALDAWLAAAAARGLRTVGGVEEDGPFGAQALVAGSPPSGPHVIVVEGRSPASVVDAAGTIGA